MSERPASDRLVETWMSPRLYHALMTRGGRFELAVVGALLILGVAIGGHIYGRRLALRDIMERDATIALLQTEGEKLDTRFNEQTATLAEVQAKLKSVQAALEAIMPAENTYNIYPNQSMNVAGGRLTIALVGPPTNEGVNININGKQQSAAAGTVIHVAPDPSTTCEVGVQSFDMFKAVLTASCAAVKPQ